MLQFLIWAGLTGAVSAAVAATIVVVNRRREREAHELEMVGEVAERIAAMDDVEDRLERLTERLDAAEQTMLPPQER